MQLIADGLLIATALTAALYCLVLSRRLRRLTDAETGIGGQIQALNAALEETRTGLAETRRGVAEARAALRAAHDTLAREVAAARSEADALAERRAEAVRAVAELDHALDVSAQGGGPLPGAGVARPDAEAGLGSGTEPPARSRPHREPVADGTPPVGKFEAPPTPEVLAETFGSLVPEPDPVPEPAAAVEPDPEERPDDLAEPWQPTAAGAGVRSGAHEAAPLRVERMAL